MMTKVLPKLSSLVDQYEEDLPDNLEEALEFLKGPLQELFQEIGREMLPKGITAQDLNNYIFEHRIEVDEFLDSNPEIAEKYMKLAEEVQQKFIERIEGPPPVPLEELEELGFDEDE